MNIKFKKGFTRSVKNRDARSALVKASRFSTAGFTLVETLVAIAIFAFAITGLISITAKGVFNTNFVKNKFTAGYLSLEGAELVRNIRDTAAIDGTTWDAVMTDNNLLGHCTIPGGACFIDADPGALMPLPQACDTIDDCPYLKYELATAIFNYDQEDFTNPRTIFRRTIFIEEITSGVEARVTSIVEWQQGSETRQVEFVYDMLNWAGQ